MIAQFMRWGEGGKQTRQNRGRACVGEGPWDHFMTPLLTERRKIFIC